MHGNRIALWTTLALALSALLLGACGNDDNSAPPPPICPVKITTPDSNSLFYSGDDVHVRWTPSGSGAAAVRLLKGGQHLGSIVEDWPNTGYVYWKAETMGQTSGDDYALMVYLDGGACADTVPIQLINTLGCVVLFEDQPTERDTLRAGEPFEVTWVSENTSGQVDIELWRREVELRRVGIIDVEMPDRGSYLWEEVTSFNEGTGGGYYIKVLDSTVGGCEGMWGPFRMVDPDVCYFTLASPIEGEVYAEGSEMTIAFTATNSTGLVNIRLYAGGELVPGGYIADGVDAGSGEYVWTVSDFGFTGPNDQYRIVLIDAGDQYCGGQSGRFTIQ